MWIICFKYFLMFILEFSVFIWFIEKMKIFKYPNTILSKWV